MRVALLVGPVEPDYDVENIGKHIPVPFTANQSTNAPVIDGTPSKGEWDAAFAYPFGYNQLDPTDQRMPEPADLDCNWRVVYKENTLYGIFNRKDDKIVVNTKKAENNDNFELFFGVDKDFTHLVPVVGKDFEKISYISFAGKNKAVWSEKGDMLEFFVEITVEDLSGMTSGWNIALVDNDSGTKTRDCQLYPLNGTNFSWQNLELGEIEFK